MKKQCFVFDLDDTLAYGAHRLGLLREGKWDEYFALCPRDKPIEHICHIARALSYHGFYIVIVTGRSDSVRKETLEWLAEHQIPCDALYMRAHGDVRPNSIAKSEMLLALRAQYEPLMAFDDQPHTCAMWRAEGIPCAQIAPDGDFVEYRRQA